MSFVEMLLPRLFSMEYFQAAPLRQLSLSLHLLSAMHSKDANCRQIVTRVSDPAVLFESGIESGPVSKKYSYGAGLGFTKMVGYGFSDWSDPGLLCHRTFLLVFINFVYDNVM